MPTNIEIKCAITNQMAAEAVALRLSDKEPETIYQEDIFFPCEGARLKLRILGPDHGELIRYQRADIPEARRSQYLIARTADPQILKEILTNTLGISAIVKKTRTLYLIGQTRVHIDEVEGLGTFLELEVVLRNGQTEAEGKIVAERLICEFGIERDQIIPQAYVDLVHQKAS